MKVIKTERAIDVKVEELAMKVKVLLHFAAELIPDKEMLKGTVDLAKNMESHVQSLSIIISALGGDYEGSEINTQIKSMRVQALYNFINTLEITERMGMEYKMKKEANRQTLEDLRNNLGI